MENDESWTFDLKGTPCDLLPILRALIRFERPWKDTIFTEEPSILQDEEIVGVTDASGQSGLKVPFMIIARHHTKTL